MGVSVASAQQFPFGKYLTMSDQELKDAKFKYDQDKNQWVLKKSNGLQGTANVLSALNGTTADIRPHVDDYILTIQRGIHPETGEAEVAFINITFYKDQMYHDILTFANDNGEELLETSSGKLIKHQFGYEGYAFILEMNQVIISATTGKTSTAFVKTKDESYNVYNFTIGTEVQAASPFLTKEAIKQQKRDEKGKKPKSASDLM